MSTYVYISRRRDPFDEAGPEISASEWLALTEQAGDFRGASGEDDEWGSVNARVWTGHASPVVFDLKGGNIETKNPDPPTIIRMKALAVALSAAVFSENGELFDERGRHAGFLRGFP